MKATIIKFEGICAICKTEDLSVIAIRKVNLPIEALEGDLLNIDTDTITIENKSIESPSDFKNDISLNLW
ncbi:DUF3006 domain-containing protein [Clostridium thailandense]|uniref:DUF3006 domain-containing protein n=1 Tax=Clostridium thailandense TaxID=2794346 RepID=A0A949TV93_9CLOT|nr:DUF3006 domain-containing protein [Clostridium thailandense]MBV7272506.1 DUF3006 domain-containing protein [Clostridium thailandense]